VKLKFCQWKLKKIAGRQITAPKVAAPRTHPFHFLRARIFNFQQTISSALSSLFLPLSPWRSRRIDCIPRRSTCSLSFHRLSNLEDIQQLHQTYQDSFESLVSTYHPSECPTERMSTTITANNGASSYKRTRQLG
jgi:hypothetical protein